MVSVDDTSLEGAGTILKQHIWNAARDTISEWTGQQLAECGLYGIRIYKEGAMLAPHVDRLPLVSSAIINVDQDVDEPWYVYIFRIITLDMSGFLTPPVKAVGSYWPRWQSIQRYYGSGRPCIVRIPFSHSLSSLPSQGAFHGKCLYPF